jgi:amino acid transporter
MSAESNTAATAADLATTPVREFTLRSAFALSFSDISPIVGIYSVFGLGLAVAGPAFFWAFPVVLIGQLLVSGVFGDLVAKWPFSGSVYAWARELAGARYGWFTNWAYAWGLTIGLSFLGQAAATNLLAAIDPNYTPSNGVKWAVAVGVIIFGSAANFFAGNWLKSLLYISMTAELLSSLGIGFNLLFFHRKHSFHALFDGMGTANGWHWFFGPFIIMVAYVGWSFLGFESAASIAEEVEESRTVLPKAIALSLAAAGVLVMFACLGLILAVPNYADVISGKDAAPIATTLETALGTGIGRIFLIFVTIGFTASMIAVQTAVTRGIWATSRDRALPFSHVLSRLGGKERVPRNAIILTAVISSALLLVNLWTTNAYNLLVSFANAGFYISYSMPLLALAWVHIQKKWVPGPASMGKWSPLVVYIATVWICFESVNIAWPRTVVGQPWYLNWGLIIMSAVLGVIGIGISAWVFRPGTEAVLLEAVEPTRDAEAK